MPVILLPGGFSRARYPFADTRERSRLPEFYSPESHDAQQQRHDRRLASRVYVQCLWNWRRKGMSSAILFRRLKWMQFAHALPGHAVR